MDPSLTALVAANVTFVGTHFAMSHPLRASLVRTVGEKGFLGVYSLVSLGAFIWIGVAFRAVGPGGAVLWNGQGEVSWAITSALTVLSLALILAALKGNPALVGMEAGFVAKAEAKGVYAITRHPMMWGFGIWAASHILVSPTPRTLVTAGAMAVLALVGAHLQDVKKEALLGKAWKDWEARTSFIPHLGKLGGIGTGLWFAALVGWVAISWLHLWLANVPAGIWRWVG